MVGTKKQLWDMFVSASKKMIEKDPNIFLNYKTSHKFVKTFDLLYNNIKNNLMKDDVIFLDRHKVAAITIIAFTRINALEYKKELENCMFWGNYKLAISVGLSYMLERLNSTLIENNCHTTITKYIMPEVFMDNIPYIDVLSRNIYISENRKNSEANVINLAEKLFLIEYITLLKYNIATDFLKHY